MKILHLTLKKEWFDIMVTGEKTLEFRKPTDWINSRLLGNKYDIVKFTNGYGADKPYFIAKFIGFATAKAVFDTCTYSNGLSVRVEAGDKIINIGEIIERGNL